MIGLHVCVEKSGDATATILDVQHYSPLDVGCKKVRDFGLNITSRRNAKILYSQTR